MRLNAIHFNLFQLKTKGLGHQSYCFSPIFFFFKLSNNFGFVLGLVYCSWFVVVGLYFFFMGVGLYLICFLWLLLMQCLKKKKKKKKKKTLLDKEWHFWTVFWLGRRLGPNLTWLDGAMGPAKPGGVGLGPRKKTCLINGSGRRSGSVGRVWVWKNPAHCHS